MQECFYLLLLLLDLDFNNLNIDYIRIGVVLRSSAVAPYSGTSSLRSSSRTYPSSLPPPESRLGSKRIGIEFLSYNRSSKRFIVR